jgi:hypothetical protein
VHEKKEKDKLEAEDTTNEKEVAMAYKRRTRSRDELKAIHAKKINLYKPKIYYPKIYKPKIYKPPNYNPRNPIPKDIKIKYPQSSPTFGEAKSLDEIIKRIKKKSQW